MKLADLFDASLFETREIRLEKIGPLAQLDRATAF
jgi:hypothetical protein